MTIKDICNACDNIAANGIITVTRNDEEIWKGYFGTLVSEITIDRPVKYFRIINGDAIFEVY